MYEDHVYGAAITYKTSYILSLLEKIKDRVIYVEDIIQVIFALEGNRIYFYDDYLVWYETNVGISEGENKMDDKTRSDIVEFYSLISESYSNNKFIKKRNRMHKVYNIKNYFLRNITLFFHVPEFAFYVLYHIIQRHTNRHEPYNGNVGFLDDSNYLEIED